MPSIFPDEASENRLIVIKQRWSGEGQLALMVDRVVELQTDEGTQCFPLYLYDTPAAVAPVTSNGDLFAASSLAVGARTRRDAITPEGLAHFHAAYPREAISKEVIFYYVYNLLHSTDYRKRYADNLAKELPRIPCLKTAMTFGRLRKRAATWQTCT